jgi:outer membrane receptor protein involved in Fe transport
MPRDFPRSASLSLRHRNPLIAAAVAIALAPPAQSADQPSSALEEIVVTANRRQQTTEDIPYNITALSSKDLEEAGATNLQNLGHLVPGLSMPELGARADSSNNNIVIRGINATNQGLSFLAPNLADPPVSTYVDDVPLFVNLSLIDIERVEVLRGPQGTLYGSGAVGGTVRLIHALPDPSQFIAQVSGGLSGTQNAEDPSYSLGGVVNIPLADTFAIRGAFQYRKDSAFTDALNEAKYLPNGQPLLPPGADPLTSDQVYGPRKGVDASDMLALRASALWKISDAAQIIAAYQHQTDNAAGFSGQQTAYSAFTDPSTGMSYPGNPGATNATNKYITSEPMTRLVDLAAITVSMDMGFATVTSSSSFVNDRYHDIIDESSAMENAEKLPYGSYYYGGYPRGAALLYDFGRDQSLAEELRLVSKSGGPWEWLTGLYYRNERTTLEDPLTIPGLQAWAALPGSANNFNNYVATYYAGCPRFSTYDQAVAAPALCGRGGVPPNNLPQDLVYNFSRATRFNDYAIYGDLTRHLTEHWQVTAGGRFFWNDFSQNSTQELPIDGARVSETSTDPYGTSAAPEQTVNDHNHIWKLNTSYSFNAAVRPYVTWSEGYRHGGANSFAIGNCIYCELNGSQIPYRPDTAKNYEVGIKGTVGGMFRYSASLYRVDWRNIQLNTFTLRSGTGVVLNGGDARSQGLEVETTLQATERLAITAGYGYTNAKLTSDFITGSFVGESGNRLPGVPENQVTLGANYVQPLANERALQYHVGASYQSSVNSNINNLYVSNGSACIPNQPATCTIAAEPFPTWRTNYREFSGFAVLEASLGWDLGDGLNLRLYGDNLTNTAGTTAWTARYAPSLYIAQGASTVNLVHPSGANYMDFVMRPRTVGLDFRYKIR